MRVTSKGPNPASCVWKPTRMQRNWDSTRKFRKY